jgi:hypothetical protein
VSKRRRLTRAVQLAAIAALLLAALFPALPARAVTLGVGLEGGGTLSYLTSTRALPDVVGLILTQRFELAPVDLTLWEDANALVVYDGGWAFIPVDVGLRVGLAGPVFRPYAGLLVNDSVSLGSKAADCGCSGVAVDNVPGLGGDVGFDLAVTFLRFGLELRGYETLISPVSDSKYGDGFVLQALLSVRAEF